MVNTQYQGSKSCETGAVYQRWRSIPSVYRGDMSTEELYAKISDTLTILTTGGERHE